MELKSEYKRGLLYFCILMVCILLFFTTPDGVSIFNGMLGLVGIKPGIPIGSNTMLYLYGIVPLVAIVLCFKKVFSYWQGYGTRFKELNAFMRLLPLLVALPVIMLSNIIQPSLIDRMYFAMLSQQNGLQAVSLYSSEEHLTFKQTGNQMTFSYNFALGNHSDEDVEFYLAFSFDNMDRTQEVYFCDENGDAKLFTLSPRQLSHFSGEFTTLMGTSAYNSSGSSVFSVILLDENERYKTTHLVRRPLL